MASDLRLRMKRVVRRRRVFQEEELEDTKLRRCLNTWDLTALGLGSTLGVGVYVLVGSVALKLAGPSIVLSFLVAAVAALFAGLCYAEFGVRAPRAGAAYIYAYVTDGELAAFWVGWINIFEYTIGAASVARGLSSFVDWAAEGAMSAQFNSTMPIAAGSPMSPHFDMFAFLLVIAVGALLAVGTRLSASVNNVFAAVNMLTILFIVIAGATVANSENWRIPEEVVPPGFGTGGFLPYGVWGMLRGAAICFYGFVGFDSISAAGEEVVKPRRALPTAIITVLATAFLGYCSVAVVVTMMAPYYELATVAAVFAHVGWDWAKWIVVVGAVFGITSSLFGALFPLPRLLYAMASDGLFFSCFGHVHSWKQVPLVATVVPTAVIASLAAILELEQLIMMMCVGTLISYTVVAICVMLHRYRSKEVSESENSPSKIKQIVGLGQKSPSQATTCIVEGILLLFLVACVASALVVKHARSPTVPAIIINVLALLLLAVMTLQPRVTPDFNFKTPLVPIIPCLSIYANIHLMIFISTDTWIRVAIWMLIGIPFYIMFACCCRSKKQNNLKENLKISHANENGKTPVEIVVESPTPPDTMNGTSNSGGARSVPLKDDNEIAEMQEIASANEIMPYETEDIIVQHASVLENNEEREAKIIDMLDKVLQAEEDTYVEMISSKDHAEENSVLSDTIRQTKSFGELSDADSDASLGIQVLAKYDVIAQVHREDLPKLTEEQPDRGEADILENNIKIEEQELVTAFNDSETNSRTDESGYSDTLDRIALNDSVEDVKDAPYIPPPPPFDETFFANSNFKKSYTVPSRPSRRRSFEQQEENKPRESVKSNSSQQGDGNITFGSDRQVHFMSKLNIMMQKRMESVPSDKEETDQRKRSNSTGHVGQNVEFSIKRPPLPYLMDLKKEITSKEAAHNLRPVIRDPKDPTENPEICVEEAESEDGDTSMSRDLLKSKLENLYKNGGPQILRPKSLKSNPPTPEEAYQTDTSSSESIAKFPKMEKNDTMKRQKDRFSEVLNSFRLSFNKDEAV